MLCIPRIGRYTPPELLLALLIAMSITSTSTLAEDETAEVIEAQTLTPEQFLQDQEVVNLNMSPEVIETVKVEAQLPLEQQAAQQQKLATQQHQSFKKTSLENQAVTDYEVIRKLANEKNVSLPRYADAPQQNFRPMYIYQGNPINVTITLEQRRSLNLRN